VGGRQLRVGGRRLRGRRARWRRSSPCATACPPAHHVVIDPAGETADAISLDEIRARGRGRDAAELEARTAAVKPEDPFTFIYTSGTTGRPRAACSRTATTGAS
jgi:long-subunit acyl-CoA synthetase (AMP-forming)